MKILIVGQGYVGLPLAVEFAEVGCEVFGFDLDKNKIELLLKGNSYIEDVESSRIQKLLGANLYHPIASLESLPEVDSAIIAVPTPLNYKRQPDLSFIQHASELLRDNLKSSTLIVNESTSYPGTLRDFIIPIIESAPINLIFHHYASSPERTDPSNSNWNLRNTPRLYSGLTSEASKKTYDLYSKINSRLIEVKSPEVAEASKLFENTFRQVNIALVNELAIICNKLHLNVYDVLEGAASKPYGFMKFTPGVGVGGHCIPVDPAYLAFKAETAGVDAQFINLASKVNTEMPRMVIDLIGEKLDREISGLNIVVVGLSYKPNVADTRESPSWNLIELLRKKGNSVSWHDENVTSDRGEVSSELLSGDFDIAIVAIRHDALNQTDVLKSAGIVFDITGTFPEEFSIFG